MKDEEIKENRPEISDRLKTFLQATISKAATGFTEARENFRETQGISCIGKNLKD